MTADPETRARLLAEALATPTPKIAAKPDAPKWAHEVADAYNRLVVLQKRALVDLARQPHGRRMFGLDELEAKSTRKDGGRT